MKRSYFITIVFLVASSVLAHDTWLQTNTPLIHPRDAIYIDLLLGNHGNDHRDFKIAGKASLDHSTVTIIDPAGKPFDLKPSLVDLGYAPKEGFWQARYEPTEPGLYLVAQHSDEIASYAPERIVRSAKTFFLVSKSLDRITADVPGFTRVIGDALEMIPQTSPIAPLGPGVPIKVQLLYQGKPLANTRVSFIPRGTTLSGDLDATYERNTDAGGLAEFEPKEAGEYLVASRHDEPQQAGPGYTTTQYSATIWLQVPAICPCCGD